MKLKLEPVILRLNEDLAGRIDKARGQMPRAVWIRTQLQDAFRMSDEIEKRRNNGSALVGKA